MMHARSAEPCSKPQDATTGSFHLPLIRIQPRLLMLFSVIVYSLLTFSALYNRYIFFELKEPYDSTAYMQVAWSMFHWPPFTTSIQENLVNYFPFNFLGDQLMWTLGLFSPLSMLPSPGLWFLAVQILIIVSGAILLYRMASDGLEDQWLALLITLCYLFSIATTLSFIRFGFRAETLFIPLALSIFYLLGKERPRLAAVALVLFLLTKHDSIPTAFLMGLYFIVINHRHRRFGIFCITAAIAYYAVGVGVVMSDLQVNPVAHFKHFAQFGDTPREAVVNMVSHPSAVLALISAGKLHFCGLLFIPAGLLALLSPIFWISSSELLINAVIPDYHALYCGWHWAMVIPFLFLGMISTMGWLLKKTGHRRWVKILLAVLLTAQILPGVRLYNTMKTDDSDSSFYKKNNIDTLGLIKQLDVIEPDASVMASGRLLWFLFDRKRIYNSRVQFHDEVDYIAILLPAVYPQLDKYLTEAISTKTPSGELMVRSFSETMNDPESKFKNYSIISQNRCLIILKHKQLPTAHQPARH